MNTQFKLNLVSYATHAGDMQQAKLWLVQNIPTLTKAERVELDGAVVSALESKYSLEATESSRPILSGWTFAGKTNEANCARVALFRARGILLGKNKKTERKERDDSGHSTAFKAFLARLTGENEEAKAKAIAEVTELFLVIKGKK